MEKRILEVLDKIVNSFNEVDGVVRIKNEYYFRFKGVPFSILIASDRKAEIGPFSFYIYPEWEGDFESLSQMFEQEGPGNINIAGYHSGESGPEAFDRMNVLWTMLSERYPTPLDKALRKVLGK